MASPAPTSAPLDALRKRSRSSSPSLDSNSPAASKKANTDLSGPANLSTLEEGEKIDSVTASPAATTAELPAGGDHDETKMAVADDGVPASADATTDLPTPMVVDLELPLNPTAGQTSTTDEAAAPAPIQMRALIVTQDASIIIGKGGKNVNEIRDKSGSKITITEAIPGSPERVMCVAGMLDAVSKVCSARLICSWLLSLDACTDNVSALLSRHLVWLFEGLMMSPSIPLLYPVLELSLSGMP